MFIDNLYSPIVYYGRAIDISVPIKKIFASKRDCEKAIHTNMKYFMGAYYGGCGYDNFSQYFSLLACKLTGVNKGQLNWDAFNELWDELFSPHENKSVQFVWKAPDNHIGRHAEELVALLHKLTN